MDPSDLEHVDEVVAGWSSDARGRRMSAHDLLSVKVTKPRWAIPNLAPVANLTTLYATPGAGKTTLYQEAIVANAIGRAFLGLLPFTDPQRFIVFDWENSPEQVGRALGRLGLAAEAPNADSFLYVFGALDINLDTDDGRAAVRAATCEQGATCLVFDNRDRAFPNTPELEGDKVAHAMLATKALAEELRVAILLVSHEPKAEYANSSAKLRGHTAWAASCDQLFRLVHKGGQRVLDHAKHRAIDKLDNLDVKLLREGPPDAGTLRLVAQASESRAARSADKTSDDVRRLEDHLDRNGPTGRGDLKRATASWSEARKAWGNDRLEKAFAASSRIWQPEGKGQPYSAEPKTSSGGEG
jgi:hypothetical protein